MKTLILFLVSSLFLSIMHKDNNSDVKTEFIMIEIREVVKDEKAANSRLPVIIVKRD